MIMSVLNLQNVNNNLNLVMKKIIYLFLLFVMATSCRAQILSLEQANTYYLDENVSLPDHVTDIKDLNGRLNPFVGHWLVTEGDKTYELFIEKKTVFSLEINKDVLLIRYKITDVNNAVIKDITGLPDDDIFVIEGSYFMENGVTYLCHYYGYGSDCEGDGDVYISVLNNTSLGGETQMDFHLTKGYNQAYPESCNDNITYSTFPALTHMVFTKQ